MRASPASPDEQATLGTDCYHLCITAIQKVSARPAYGTVCSTGTVVRYGSTPSQRHCQVIHPPYQQGGNFDTKSSPDPYSAGSRPLLIGPTAPVCQPGERHNTSSLCSTVGHLGSRGPPFGHSAGWKLDRSSRCQLIDHWIIAPMHNLDALHNRRSELGTNSSRCTPGSPPTVAPWCGMPDFQPHGGYSTASACPASTTTHSLIQRSPHAYA